LVRGWIHFIVRSNKDVEIIPRKDRIWGPFGLSINKWKLVFDLGKEPSCMQKIWVMLPKSLIELWCRKIMEGIGNFLGNFITLEYKWWNNEDYRVFKLLVEMDLREGLLVEIDIEWGS
jgi:hypothetical protein